MRGCGSPVNAFTENYLLNFAEMGATVMNQPCNLCKKQIYFLFEYKLQARAPKA